MLPPKWTRYELIQTDMTVDVGHAHTRCCTMLHTFSTPYGHEMAWNLNIGAIGLLHTAPTGSLGTPPKCLLAALPSA